jgi:hypothetical protein
LTFKTVLDLPLTAFPGLQHCTDEALLEPLAKDARARPDDLAFFKVKDGWVGARVSSGTLSWTYVFVTEVRQLALPTRKVFKLKQTSGDDDFAGHGDETLGVEQRDDEAATRVAPTQAPTRPPLLSQPAGDFD